jgi:hypothetical protein
MPAATAYRQRRSFDIRVGRRQFIEQQRGFAGSGRGTRFSHALEICRDGLEGKAPVAGQRDEVSIPPIQPLVLTRLTVTKISP